MTAGTCYFLSPAFLGLLVLLPVSLSTLVPRISFPIGCPGRTTAEFSSPGIRNTTMLLLSNNTETLLVGARDSVLLLDVSQPGTMTMKNKLDWSPSSTDLQECSAKGKNEADCHNFIRVLSFLNDTHVYACGTHAFSPRCTYIDLERLDQAAELSNKASDGRGRCPYDPYQRNTAIVVGGELYTATVADYRGNRPVISRHLSHANVKLDDTLGWLEEPTFVTSEFIPSEDKVYFFFSEVGREYEFFDKIIVSRVAQVCTSDVGGLRILQRRWTTFAKAQLLCQSKNQLPYNVILDIVSLPPPEGASEDEMVFYGIFSSQWSKNVRQSAVCAFRLKDIKATFAGNYKVLNRDNLRWSSKAQEKAASPGQCGLHNASDATLRFVKDNFLADQVVLPVGRSLSMASSEHRYTNIAAQGVRTINGRSYTVLFLLTDSGFLHKTVLLDEGPFIVEEVRVFKHPQPVRNILLSVTKGVVFVGFTEGVAQVPVSNCSFYASCADCILARDPFCGWDASHRQCVEVSSEREDLRQDVDNGNVEVQCSSLKSRSDVDPTEKELVVSPDAVVTLPCLAASRLSTLHWDWPRGRSPTSYLRLANNSLQFLARPDTMGKYTCYSVENDYRQTLALYSVRLRSSPSPRLFDITRSRGPPPTVARLTPSGVMPTSRPEETTTVPGGTRSEEGEAEANEGGARAKEGGADQDSKQRRGNLTSVRQPILTEADSSPFGGDQLLLANGRSYYKELVTVSVLLSLTLCMLVLTTLYALRPRARGRAGPQVFPGTDEGSVVQERDPLSGGQPPFCLTKNGQAQDKPSTASNGTLQGSNGHLPNTPI